MSGYFMEGFFILLSFLIIISFFIWKSTRIHKQNLPPCPPKVPIFGNLLQLGLLPHRSLKQMADRYGPLMTIYMGKTPSLVISSPETAMEILKTHDIAFSDRPNTRIHKKLLYNCTDMVFSPYSDYWRQLRSICVTTLLSSMRVQSFKRIREEETASFVRKIQDSESIGINLSELFSSFANNMICRVAFGREFTAGGAGKKLKNMLDEFQDLMGTFDVGEYVPWLSWLNKFNGLNAKLEKVSMEMDEIFDQIVTMHMEKNRLDLKENEMDFVDTMLEIQKNGGEESLINRDCIKGMILDMFVAGTDTTHTALEWTMTELLRHPSAMKKTQDEIRAAISHKCLISEDDLPQLSYMKAVIKEVFRLHPPTPLLVPRQARENVRVEGYDIPAKTPVYVNAWAMGRSSATWEEPEEFLPERFLDGKIDYRGTHFELIPFGAGRRGCPGAQFASSAIEMLLANILHGFEWKLPGGTKPADLDVLEVNGLVVRRKFPLIASATVF